LSYARNWRGQEVYSEQQVIYITTDKNKLNNHRVSLFESSYGISDVPIAVMSEPIDLLNKRHLDELIDSISSSNKEQGLNEYSSLIIVDIQGGLTDECSPNALINSIDYLRRAMNSTFLLVFNEGICQESHLLSYIINSADVAHEVKTIDCNLSYVFDCTKMKNFAKPSLNISCVKSLSIEGDDSEI
jgi:hypothetical protein